MRTTVTIPDEIINDLMRYSRAKTRTESINNAIRDWIRLKKIQQIKKLQGNVPYSGDLPKLRKLELKELEKMHGKHSR